MAKLEAWGFASEKVQNARTATLAPMWGPS